MAELGEGVTLLSWRVGKNGLQKRGKITEREKPSWGWWIWTESETGHVVVCFHQPRSPECQQEYAEN